MGEPRFAHHPRGGAGRCGAAGRVYVDGVGALVGLVLRTVGRRPDDWPLPGNGVEKPRDGPDGLGRFELAPLSEGLDPDFLKERGLPFPGWL